MEKKFYRIQKVVNLEEMFKEKMYADLVKSGVIEEFAKRGAIDGLIEYYPKYRAELGHAAYLAVLHTVTEKMLKEYLQKGKPLDFFLIHPLGLKVLAENYYSGYIAAHEKEFSQTAENYPKEWRTYCSQKGYSLILNRMRF